MSSSVMLIVTAALAAKPPRPGDWSFGWTGVASIAAVALAIIVCVWAITIYFSAHRQREKHAPWKLFFDLCAAHKLSRRERKLLKRLAHQHRLEQPAMLFIEPSWYAPQKQALKWGRHGEDLDRLRQRLFSMT